MWLVRLRVHTFLFEEGRSSDKYSQQCGRYYPETPSVTVTNTKGGLPAGRLGGAWRGIGGPRSSLGGGAGGFERHTPGASRSVRRGRTRALEDNLPGLLRDAILQLGACVSAIALTALPRMANLWSLSYRSIWSACSICCCVTFVRSRICTPRSP